MRFFVCVGLIMSIGFLVGLVTTTPSHQPIMVGGVIGSLLPTVAFIFEWVQRRRKDRREVTLSTVSVEAVEEAELLVRYRKAMAQLRDLEDSPDQQ